MKPQIDKQARLEQARRITAWRAGPTPDELQQMQRYLADIVEDADRRAAKREADRLRRQQYNAARKATRQRDRERAEARAQHAREAWKRCSDQAAAAAAEDEMGNAQVRRLMLEWRAVMRGLTRTPQQIPQTESRPDATPFGVLSASVKNQAAVIAIGHDYGTMGCSFGGRLIKPGEPTPVSADMLMRMIGSPYFVLVERVKRKAK